MKTAQSNINDINAYMAEFDKQPRRVFARPWANGTTEQPPILDLTSFGQRNHAALV
jgi:hypothetical protein